MAQRLFVYVIAGVIGVWAGVLAYLLAGNIISFLFPASGCGASCGLDLTDVFMVGSISGAFGAVVGYLIPRYTLRRPVVKVRIYGYALVGTVLWIVLGALAYAAVILSGLEENLGSDSALALMLTVFGALIGLICMRLERSA